MIHSPPVENNTLNQALSFSDPALNTKPSQDAPSMVTIRHKRQRTEGSPEAGLSHDHLRKFTLEIKEMLSSWREDQDRRLSDWKNDQDISLSTLVKEVTELRAQCLKIQTTNSDIEKSMEYMSNCFDGTQLQLSQLQKENQEKDLAILQLQNQINDLQLKTRTATIELRNVPNKDSEKQSDLFSIVANVAKVINTDIQTSDLRDVYRLPGKSNTSRPIVVEFATVTKRNHLLSSIRKYNKDRPIVEKLNTQILGFPGMSEPVYVDEHLAPSTRKLLYETRQVAKANKYSCWHSNGKIYLRTDQEEKAIVIRSDKQLATFSANNNK